MIETIDGPLGVAHNGNLVNAHLLRRELLERGVGLQTSSDTEVMVHLLTGAGGDWMSRIRVLMSRAEGAFALTILTRDAIYGVRDPWGFRPLVIGQIERRLRAGLGDLCVLGDRRRVRPRGRAR